LTDEGEKDFIAARPPGCGAFATICWKTSFTSASEIWTRLFAGSRQCKGTVKLADRPGMGGSPRIPQEEASRRSIVAGERVRELPDLLSPASRRHRGSAYRSWGERHRQVVRVNRRRRMIAHARFFISQNHRAVSKSTCTYLTALSSQHRSMCLRVIFQVSTTLPATRYFVS
jgi:hypothetical protein